MLSKVYVYVVTSCQDPCLHRQLEDLVALLEHLVLEGAVLHRQLAILEDEFLQDVAVVPVYGEHLGEAHEDLFLHLVLWVDERGQLFSEVNGLHECYLGSLLLVGCRLL